MDVLNRACEVLQSRFLEASAGTGKTFAIEQLIARFILEGDFKIEEILAVTFTRAAAREMRARIHSNLEKLLEIRPDYLELLIEKGVDVETRLKRALVTFDEAQIFTIHGFCQRALSEFAFEAHVAFEASDSTGHSLKRQLVREFLKTPWGTPEEAEELLKECRQNLDTLLDRICHAIDNPKQASPLVRQIAEQCRPLWLEKQRAEEILTPDGLLAKMAEALERPHFVQRIRAKYRALIVDEFQDTDPLSWKIFEKLFLEDSSKIVYLVGDPKQSIYGFRSADVYTYMRAGEQLGKEKRAYLTTNYRSRPRLVEALNQLFTSPDWMELPSLPGALSYIPVQAGRKEGKLDGESPIHFFLAQGAMGREKSWPTKALEREKLFPYIAEELIRLHSSVSWSEMAVLVKDRFQAERLHAYLSSLNIPAAVRRTLNLAETDGFLAFENVLRAALHPEDQSAVQNALLGPLLEKEVSFRELHRILMQEGFPAFYDALERAGLIADPSVRQTAEILLETACPPQHLLKVMAQLKKSDPEEEERLKLRGDGGSDRVQIMTLFASKGLEFDIVFALGLASRHTGDEDREQDAEKMRQLYVALTRAKERLYIPLLFEKSTRSSAAMELFWKKRFGVDLTADNAVFLLEEMPGVTFSWAEGTPQALEKENSIEEEAENEEIPLTSFPKQYFASFSSLSKKATPTLPKEVYGLPAGAETGTLIHTILERIFREGLQHLRDRNGLKKIIHETVRKTSLESWEATVEEMVLQTLKLPLIDNFALKDLKPTQVTAELEFLYPDGDRLIKGFVDLFFCHEDRYYILDWKTNWIDSTITPKTCMEENDYFLQAALYTEAIERYVKLFDKREVAGALYFFLRGPAVYKVSREEMRSALERNL